MTDERKALTPGRTVFVIVYVLAYPVVLFLLAGDWLWIEGWIFSLWFITIGYYSTFYLNRHSPDLLRERFRRVGSGGEKGWDKVFVYALIIVFLAWFVIMPLDVRRFYWTAHFPLLLKTLGGLVLLPAFYFLFRALADNPYASHLVRIQKERDQRVIDTGVYAVVRHPMYLGGMMYFLGPPLLLGSKYGLLLGVLLALMFIFRIFGEEKTLMSELEGYADYRKKVRYRLIPGVW